ncbi:MAG: hypothetical protein Q7T74_05775 [Candidatus Saccharibacteria bacterium]|nr:hypothetical protein [Candidatus Saccharibacteria bacterium]
MFLFLIYIVYLALWVLLIYVSCFIVWKISKSKKIAAMVGSVAFLIMYWPAFGDYIPTWWAHKQLCEKEAGFKVYVTPEQWAKENPGILETLVPYRDDAIKEGVVLGNERIGLKFAIYPYPNLNVRKSVSTIIDIKNGEVLAEDIDFRRGYINYSSDGIAAVKIWLFLHSCYSQEELKEIVKKRKYFLTKLKTIWGN